MIPIRREIGAISNDPICTITTTEPHGYLPGLYVRINLPENFGMELLDGQQFLIGDITPTTFSIPVDTTISTPFATGIANLTGMTNANPMVITVDAAALSTGMQIIFYGFTTGPVTLNGTMCKVTRLISPSSAELSITGIGLVPFAGTGSIKRVQAPQVIPIAEIAGTLQNAEKNNLTPIGGFQ